MRDRSRTLHPTPARSDGWMAAEILMQIKRGASGPHILPLRRLPVRRSIEILKVRNAKRVLVWDAAIPYLTGHLCGAAGAILTT